MCRLTLDLFDTGVLAGVKGFERLHGDRMWRIVVTAAVVCLAGASGAEPCGVLVVRHELDAAEQQNVGPTAPKRPVPHVADGR
jgi:hypothetical protein